MEQTFNKDCKKQNYVGIKSYWDLDINCSQIYNLPNITEVNTTKQNL